MDIKMMHEMKEKLAECAKHELDKGIESLDTKEFGEVVDMLKDLAEAEYYATITMEMKKAENEYGEDYDYMGTYEERRGYRGQPRDRKGRYMSRRGYEEPPYMHMTPEMYREHDPEWYRDMDRISHGKMYYSESASDGKISREKMGSSTMIDYNIGNPKSGMNNYGKNESKYDHAKRSYTEAKEIHKSNTSEDKQVRMGVFESIFKVVEDDIMELKPDMTPEEKAMAKQKFTKIATMLQ